MKSHKDNNIVKVGSYLGAHLDILSQLRQMAEILVQVSMAEIPKYRIITSRVKNTDCGSGKAVCDDLRTTEEVDASSSYTGCRFSCSSRLGSPSSA